MTKDYYNILGVDKNVDEKTLKKTYRKLSKKYHPDMNKDNPEAEEKFKEIAEAYDVLSNPTKKENYDKFGSADGSQFGRGNPYGDSFDMNDIFESFFGGRKPNRPQPRKGADIRVNIKLKLEEVFSGVHKKIKYKRNEVCNPCGGEGGTTQQCVTCRGLGNVNIIQNTPFGRVQNTTRCGQCRGSGKQIIKACKDCGGNGVNIKEELLEFDIPRGIMEGEKLVIHTKGNSIQNGVNGDLVINISELPHEVFRRQNMDLYQRLNLKFKELVLGGPIEVDTIDGRIRVNIKSGTEIGHILRVPQKGLDRGGSRGDMMLEIWLEVPTKLTEEEKEKINHLNI